MRTPAKKMLFFVFLCLAVVAFTQTPLVNAKDIEKDKDTVTRSIRLSGQITMMMTPLYEWSMIDIGVASHLGSFSDFGFYDLDGNGYGILFVANGDQIFWKQTKPKEVEFVGGTGRFENASGSFTFTMSDFVPVPGPDANIYIYYSI